MLSRLEDRALVRNNGIYWALGESDDVATYLRSVESTTAADDRFGKKDLAEWMNTPSTG